MDLTPKKILIVKPSALGDIVHTLPVLNALRRRFPDSKIDWVVAKGLHQIVENHPMIRKLWIIDKNKWKKLALIKETFAEIARLRKELMAEKYDLTIDLQGLLRTGLITKFAGSPVRIGFAAAREGAPIFYTDKVEADWECEHAVERYLRLVEQLGCDTAHPEFPLPPFDENIPLLNELPARFALISPSAGKEANRWPAERFGEVAAGLDVPSVVIGDNRAAELAEVVVSNSDGKAVSVAGRTSITDLLALTKHSDLLVANDTGPIHIAAALGVPVCAVFGPANPVRTGPYGDIHKVVSLRLPCSPCHAKRRHCDWKCLRELDSHTVLAAAKKLLAEHS